MAPFLGGIAKTYRPQLCRGVNSKRGTDGVLHATDIHSDLAR